MTSQPSDLEVIVLAEPDLIRETLAQWQAESDRSISVTWVENADQFRTSDSTSQLIIADTNALGMGVAEVVKRAKRIEASPPVVLVAEQGESGRVADALQRGVDEYVIRSADRSGFQALLLQALDRAVTRQRDLPYVTNGPSRPHFWGLLEAMPIPTKVLDEEGKLLYVSPSFAEFLKYDREEMEGKPIFDFMHPDEVDDAVAAYKQLLSAGEVVPPTGYSYGQDSLPDRRYLTKNLDDDEERVRWGNLYLMPLWHADGSMLHVVGFMVDITQRKTTAMELEVREEHERAILNTTVDGIMTVDRAGRVEAFNRTCEKIFGYDTDEIQGRNVEVLLAPDEDESVLELIGSIAASSEPRQVEGRTKSGRDTPLELGVGEMQVRGESKYTVIVRDISDQIDFLERVHRAERMEAIGHFAGGIAHDFNNVLAIVRMNAHLLSEQDLVVGDLGEKYLTKIFDAADRATRLSKNLLSLTPGSGGSSERTNINDVIDKLKDVFDSMVEEDIELEFRLDEDLRPVQADIGDVEQVIMNLTLNARDAMPDGGQLAVVTCNISADPEDETTPRELEPGDYVLLEVHDSGEGIPEEIRDRIFDPYFTTKGPGTGLGLGTVYRIVESLGGIIDVESEEGVGSTFRAYVPVLEDEAEESKPGPDEAKPRETRVSETETTILVAEDEEDIRSSLSVVLERAGYEVLIAADGNDALRIARDYAGRIDLLLTDMVMPGLNGVELAEKFTEMYPDSAVIFVSGYAGDVLERKEIGIEQVHLMKPFEIGELKETIRKSLR